MRLPIMNKDVRFEIRPANVIARREVSGVGCKGDKAPIGGKRRSAITASIPLFARGRDADAGGSMQLAVMHEHIVPVVGIARNEIAGEGGKGDVASIRGKHCFTGVSSVRLLAVGIDADAGGLVRQPIVHEHIAPVVGIAGNEIAHVGRVGHKAAVGRKRRSAKTVSFPLFARGRDADADGLTRDPVVNKDVTRS